jgi:hypothetical protein
MSIVITPVCRKISTWFTRKHLYILPTYFLYMGLFPKCFLVFPARKQISRLTSNIFTSHTQNHIFSPYHQLVSAQKHPFFGRDSAFSYYWTTFLMSDPQTFWVIKLPFFKISTLSTHFSIQTSWTLTCYSLEFRWMERKEVIRCDVPEAGELLRNLTFSPQIHIKSNLIQRSFTANPLRFIAKLELFQPPIISVNRKWVT